MKVFISLSQTVKKECHTSCVHQSSNDAAVCGKSFQKIFWGRSIRIVMHGVAFLCAADFKQPFEQQSAL